MSAKREGDSADASGAELTNELLQAILTASEDQKHAALRVLRGEREEEDAPAAIEPYLTLKELARHLNVSVSSLWRWGVPGHELGGRRRFRLSEVEAYLESEAFRKRAAALKRERRVSRKGRGRNRGTT